MRPNILKLNHTSDARMPADFSALLSVVAICLLHLKSLFRQSIKTPCSLTIYGLICPKSQFCRSLRPIHHGKLFANNALQVILIGLNRHREFAACSLLQVLQTPLHAFDDLRNGSCLVGKDAAMTQKDSDLQKIQEIIQIMKDNDLLEVEIKHGDDKIFLKRFQPGSPTVNFVPMTGQKSSELPPASLQTQSPSQTPPPATQLEEELVEIKSLVVGTFYATPSPDSEPYVEIGSHVEPQTVVCIIEAMKVMNEIKAETRGTITDILITNGQAVEYGQVLFTVKPD